MASAYRWTITKYHLDDKGSSRSRVGTEGPRGCEDATVSNPTHWSAYDDDGECYYEGMLYGDFEGLEPLYDFCMPDAGCTAIKINGKFV